MAYNWRLFMMKKLFFSVFLLLMMAIGAMAQETLTVYDGTVTSSYVPMYVGYFDDFTRSQYVIPAEDLTDMENGQITSIRYYTSLTSAYTTASTVDFYITEVNNTSVSAFVDKASATMIYQGTLDFVLVGDKCELTITFGTPYTYNGGNLLIGCENTTDAGYQFVYFFGQTVNNASISGYNSSSLANVTPTQRNFIPKTTFTYTPVAASCPRVNNLSANNLTSSSADITWEAGGSETAWVLKYGPAGFNVETEGTTQNISTTPAFEITGLSANTAYDVYVKAVCGGGDESTWRKVSFRTACGAIASFPWSENFESYESGNFTEPCWVNEHISGSGSQIFKIYTYSNGTNSTKQLQLPDMTSGTMTKLMLPEFNFGGVAHQFVLDVYRNATGSSYTSEGIRIYASADGEIEGATELGFVYRNYTQTDGNVVPAELASGWYTYEFNIPITGTCYIILRGESQYGSATYMDNFIVREAPTCIKPTAFTVSNITGHTATLTWAAGADETAWQISLNDDEDDLINVTEPTYTLTGLAPESDYTVKVRANCGGSDGVSEWTANASFSTTVSCPAPADLTLDAYTTTTATLSWAAGEATSWLLMYGTDSEFAADSYTEVNVSTTPTYEITGLTPETVYYARVMAVCGVDDESDWSDVLSFEPTAKIVIGTAASTNSYLPTACYYNNSYTQQIYTVAEIGNNTGAILSVDFYCQSGITRNLDVYMVATDKEAFASATDWISVSASDLVYSGNVTFTANAWTTIELDSPFAYDGTQNVAIVVDDNTGSYQSGVNFRTFDATSMALSARSDGTNYDPTNPPTTSTYKLDIKNHIRLLIGEPPSCAKPTALAASNFTTTAATLTWNAGADETAWQICVGGDEDNLIDVEGTPTYDMSELTAATTYQVKVRANCGGSDGVSEWTSEIEFTTSLCEAEDQCQISYELSDQYDDGWDGSVIRVVDVATSQVIAELTVEDDPVTGTISVCNGREIRFQWVTGGGYYDSEASYTITDINGEEIFSGSGAMESPVTYTVNCSTPVNYTITATAGENGTITPNGEVIVAEGGEQAFTITADANYRILSVIVDGDDVTAAVVENNGVYTFTNVTADHTIAATFEVIPATTYTITATAGENGTITPAGAVTVDEGADQAFTITPAAGYQIASVMVDTDNDVTDELEYNDGVYTYTFENVVANHTIHATFELLQTYTITVNITGNGEVVATDEDDNVYPMENGVVTVNNGADVYLEITPAENYQIESVTIDGVPEELEQEDLAGYSYSFFVVEQNHIIDVTFVPADAVDMIDAASMAIYPNPNNGMFSIDFSNIEGDATYEIIDVRGAVVETRSINVMNGATMNFNHNLDAGTYFVRIISGDKVYVEQIVVE